MSTKKDKKASKKQQALPKDETKVAYKEHDTETEEPVTQEAVTQPTIHKTKETDTETEPEETVTQPTDKNISFLPKFVQRVTPTVVTSLLSSAIGYYDTNKSKYPVVVKAEASIAKLSEPVIEKLKPTLNELDSFGCRQLDRIEVKVESSKKKLEASIYKPAEQAFESTKTFVWNNFVNTKPVSQALDITEYAVDRFLPSTNKKVAEESSSGANANDVDIKLTRLRSKTIDKLKAMQPLSSENIKKFTHSVSLIEYASKYLDRESINYGIEESKEFIRSPIQKSSEYVSASYNYVHESRVAKTGLSYASSSVQKVYDIGNSVVQRLPKPIVTKLGSVYEKVGEEVEKGYGVVKERVPYVENVVNRVYGVVASVTHRTEK